MKKESIILRFFAGILSIFLCIGLAGFAILSGIKPLCVSLIKDMIVTEIDSGQIIDVVDDQIPMSDGQKQIVTEILSENEEIDELIDVYLSSATSAIASGEFELEDTTQLYKGLNEDIVNKVAQNNNISLTDEKRAEIESELLAKEAELESALSESVNYSLNGQMSDEMGEISAYVGYIQDIYNFLFSDTTFIIYGIVLCIVAFIIVLMRWYSSGWLINIGVAGVFAAIIIALMPVVLTLAESQILKNQYEITTKNYFVNFALVTGAISLLLIAIRVGGLKKNRFKELDY